MKSSGQHGSLMAMQRAYWARISDRERKRAARATQERKRRTFRRLGRELTQSSPNIPQSGTGAARSL